MDDSISRQAAVKAAECIVEHHAITPYKTMAAAMDHLKRILNGMPSAQPKQKIGEWIKDGRTFKDGYTWTWIHCSVCGAQDIDSPMCQTPYCPWCGAKMENSNE